MARETLPVYIESGVAGKELTPFSPCFLVDAETPARAIWRALGVGEARYQILQVGMWTMGWPALQLKAFWN